MAAAAQSARALVSAGAGALVSWGMAGGLDPALVAGTVFLPGEVVAADGTALLTARLWRERLGEAVRSQGGTALPIVLEGRLLTSPKAIGSLSDKAALFQQTGAAAVDMESVAIAQIAHTHRLPFIAIRVIVDSAEDVLPRAVTAAADSEGPLQVWRLMGALARAPADLAPLMRLAQRYRAANRSLATIARVGSLGRYVS